MPGPRRAKRICTLAQATLLAMLALSVLSGCYARRPIASDPPPAPQATVQAAEAAPMQAEAAPMQAEAAATAEPAPVQAAPPAPAILEKDVAEVQAAQAPEQTPAQAPAPAPAQAPAQTPAPAQPAAAHQYAVQIGAFATEKNAQGAVTWLKEKGFEAAQILRVEQGQTVLFRVRTGPLQDLATTHKALDALKADWPQAFIPGD